MHPKMMIVKWKMKVREISNLFLSSFFLLVLFCCGVQISFMFFFSSFFLLPSFFFVSFFAHFWK